MKIDVQNIKSVFTPYQVVITVESAEDRDNILQSLAATAPDAPSVPGGRMNNSCCVIYDAIKNGGK